MEVRILLKNFFTPYLLIIGNCKRVLFPFFFFIRVNIQGTRYSADFLQNLKMTVSRTFFFVPCNQRSKKNKSHRHESKGLKSHISRRLSFLFSYPRSWHDEKASLPISLPNTKFTTFFFSIHLTFPVLTVYRTLVTYGFNNGLSFHRLLWSSLVECRSAEVWSSELFLQHALLTSRINCLSLGISWF